MLHNIIKADLSRIWNRKQISVPWRALSVRKKNNFQNRPQNRTPPYFHQDISTISGNSKQIPIYGGQIPLQEQIYDNSPLVVNILAV